MAIIHPFFLLCSFPFLPFSQGWKVIIFCLGSDLHQTWTQNARCLDRVGWSSVSSSASTGLAPGRNKPHFWPRGVVLRIHLGQFRWSRLETAKPLSSRPDIFQALADPPPTSLLTKFRCLRLAGQGFGGCRAQSPWWPV